MWDLSSECEIWVWMIRAVSCKKVLMSGVVVKTKRRMGVAVHRGVMMADTLSFNAKIGVVDFWVFFSLINFFLFNFLLFDFFFGKVSVDTKRRAVAARQRLRTLDTFLRDAAHIMSVLRWLSEVLSPCWGLCVRQERDGGGGSVYTASAAGAKHLQPRFEMLTVNSLILFCRLN